MSNIKIPLPIFDTLDNIKNTDFSYLSECYCREDIKHAVEFLLSYRGSKATFNSYRREIERLLQWLFLIKGKRLIDLKRQDIEEYVEFCKKPPSQWIGDYKPPKFILVSENIKKPHPDWRPFIVAVPKAKKYQGVKPEIKNFEFTGQALKDLFAIIGSFFNFLVQEEYLTSNPVATVKQKSKYIRKIQGKTQVRRLSELQWSYVIEAAKSMADLDPEKHERTLFMLSMLYSMYLRISELAESERWSPKMNDFWRDSENNWWFTTVGKGNKQRQIAVSDAMLEALKRWRKFLNMPLLPSSADSEPLLPKQNGRGSITCISHIRSIIQECFDMATSKMRIDGFIEEADSMLKATVHWLRHTGISDDVKFRPREHVRDDAGHSSSAITDRYIDIDLKERHKSAKKKQIFA